VKPACILFLCPAFLLALVGLISPCLAEADPDTVCVIDWTKTDGRINRGLFSTQGFMQVYVEPDPMVMETFTLINPQETHTRLETYIQRLEPENDDDDPNHFNWDKLYPERMIRFIEDGEAFDQVVEQLGMERLSLLLNIAPWLKSDNPDRPIADVDEWVEFAAAVVQWYNGSGSAYRPKLRYVQVWNEPNLKQFYTGTMKSYFELFNATAKRIHRDYPGVMVGGPTPATTDPAWRSDEWMEAFLKECGAEADFITYHHYGPQGQPVEVITDAIHKWVGEFRKLPGKERGKMMITELDAWFHGWPKAQYILERQFRLLDVSDLLLSVHHFCCLAYNESGNYTFGVVDKQGGVLEGTFWPYWLFRNLIGDQVYSVKQGPRQGELDLIASRDQGDGQWLGTAVFHNRTSTSLPVKVYLFFPPQEEERVLAIDRITENFKGVGEVLLIPARADRAELQLDFEPGEGVALNLQQSGRRFFAFRDLNHQEGPWLGITSSRDAIGFQERCDLEVRLLNTNFQPVSGILDIRGLPEGWKIEPLSGDTKVNSLGFGKEHLCRFRFEASTLVRNEQVSPYAVLLESADRAGEGAKPLAHSIATTLDVTSPIQTQVLPIPVHAVRGEENQITLQVTNGTDRLLSGTFSLTLPPGCRAANGAKEFSIPPKERLRYQFPFIIQENAPLGRATGTLTLNYLGSELAEEFVVDVGPGRPVAGAIPLDLSRPANIDAAAFEADRGDYDSSRIGRFVYPADFTPSDRIVRIRGVPYRMASLEDGQKNAILPQGQTLTIPEGHYQGVALMGYGHDGNHPGQWILHYADGTRQVVDSQIPEWCTPAPEGFEVAFTAPYRYIPGGPAPPPCELFTWTLECDPARTLTAIEWPRMIHAYVYAITLLPSQ